MKQKINKQVESAFNKLLNAELWSSSLHLVLQTYLENADMPVLASWMNLQSQKKCEYFHKLSELLLREGGNVVIQSSGFDIPNWQTPLEALDALLAHERYMMRIVGTFRKLSDPLCKKALLLYKDEMSMGEVFLELIHLLARESKRRLPFDPSYN